ncbi:CDP-archaeol synthase [SAR202 cluster bacterium AC-409-J13_OGT_754m]|nr:CDP-archaeol synthase [SAR202 cluster bacterium AC-409-J13_OGT_754m]
MPIGIEGEDLERWFPKSKSFLPRLVVSLIGIPALIAIIISGYPLTTAIVTIAAIWSLIEYHRMIRTITQKDYFYITVIWTTIFVFNAQFAHEIGNYSVHIIVIGILFTLTLTIINQSNNKTDILKNWMLTCIGPIYIGFLLSHALLLREINQLNYNGTDWLLYVLLLTFAIDTAAYCIGTSIGKYKLAESISPNKTWEGVLGGITAAIIASLALSALFDLPISEIEQIFLGMLLGVTAVFGDLAESIIKRATNTGNSGTLLPGHGGMLDRIDSLLLTIPVTYYLLTLIII